MIGIILTIVKLLIALCIVATIHEFGHFLFAKLFKTQVNEFSIGFGPKIVQKKFKETMYSLRWLPLGGYVSIEGEDGESESENSFVKKNTLQKVIILIAGATFNALLAIVIFLSVTMTYPTYTSKITEVESDSVLNELGILPGDVITSINGKKVNIAQDLTKTSYTDSETTTITYKRDSKEYTVSTENAVKDIGYIGIMFKTTEDEVTNEIEMVDSGKVATKADIKSGDKILSINGQITEDGKEVQSIVADSAGIELTLEIERNGEVITKTLIPDSKKSFDLGIVSTEEVKTNIVYAFDKAYINVTTIVGSYVDLFKGKVKVTDMSGIVGISEVVSKTDGILEYINLIGILSLAIGVANVMPFPPLDGGKIVIVLGEAITRKKLPLKAEAIISYLGFGLLILLTIVVTYNDILRVF